MTGVFLETTIFSVVLLIGKKCLPGEVAAKTFCLEDVGDGIYLFTEAR